MSNLVGQLIDLKCQCTAKYMVAIQYIRHIIVRVNLGQNKYLTSCHGSNGVLQLGNISIQYIHYMIVKALQIHNCLQLMIALAPRGEAGSSGCMKYYKCPRSPLLLVF